MTNTSKPKGRKTPALPAACGVQIGAMNSLKRFLSRSLAALDRLSTSPNHHRLASAYYAVALILALSNAAAWVIAQMTR